MKKLLTITLLLAASAAAQTFDAETYAAQQAVHQMQVAAETRVAADTQQIGALNATVTDMAAQIEALRAIFTWRDLEYHRWGQNWNSQVGGSGNGTASQTLATGPNSATFSISPTPPAVGSTNYFDVYNTLDFAPDESRTHFKFTQPWMFPTQTDANASQCLEMEVRQSLPGGLMAVWALQMQFSGKQLRIWDHSRAWFSTGTAQPRLTPGTWYAVTLEGHRDETTVYYDSITINGVTTALSYSYPMWNNGWRPMTRIATQLDGNGGGTPYTVKRGATVFSSR